MGAYREPIYIAGVISKGDLIGTSETSERGFRDLHRVDQKASARLAQKADPGTVRAG